VSVILGHLGQVELRRKTGDNLYRSVVNSSDVNPQKNRFSFDFPTGMLLTGDLLEIKATDGGGLDFVAPSGWFAPGKYPDGKWFCHVDGAGGVSLYLRFDDAVSGEVAGRVDLQLPSRNIPIAVQILDNLDRIVGQVTDFQLNTSRDAVDVTELGTEFRQQYSALISGSGQLNCFFDYERRRCDETSRVSSNVIEMPVYLHQLLLRTQLGSGFWAKLTLAGRGPKPMGYKEDMDDEVWTEFDALVTNVAIAFEATQPVRTTIDFVTTGEIKLRTRMVTNFIVQEQDGVSRLRTEEMTGNGFLLLEEGQEE
jgi:hypothetical protein